MKLLLMLGFVVSLPTYGDGLKPEASYRGGYVEPANFRLKGRQGTDLCEVRITTYLRRDNCGMDKHSYRSVECGTDRDKNWSLDGGVHTYWLSYKDFIFQLDQLIYQSHLGSRFYRGETAPSLLRMVSYVGTTASRVTLARETIRRTQRLWDSNLHKVINCVATTDVNKPCLLYTSPSPRD